MEKTIRVLIANRPRLLRELILTTLADQPDIEVVGEVDNEADVLGRLAETKPDVVVIAQDRVGERPSLCDQLFRVRPDMRIIAVALHHRHLVHYWTCLDIRAREVEASEDAVLEILRANFPGGSGWGLVVNQGAKC